MTTVIQRNRSTLKNLSEDVELNANNNNNVGNDNIGQSSSAIVSQQQQAPQDNNKASRIAANLAKLDASPSLIRAPLTLKGYGWRAVRALQEASVGVSASNNVGGINGGNNSIGLGNSDLVSDGKESWKEWAASGIRRRSCKVMITLALVAAIVGVCAVLAFSAVYGWIFSRDPCVVSVDTMHKLRAFPRKSHLVPDFVPVLPKIIHQQWKTKNIPEGVYTKWHLKFKELFPEPEYKHMLWTDENAREMIKNDFPFFLQAYDNYEFGIQRADAARYFVLYKYGGLYADLDYEPLVNFWQHLPKDRVALVESPYLYNEKSQNSLMSSPIADPLWNETFALLIERKDKPVLQATGPMFLDALMKRVTEPFNLLPCENFQRLPLHLSAAEEVSPFMSQLHRELLGRLAPMKYCGDYHNPECQYGKHHNTASYLPDTGVLKLLWT
jgi:hypothetical protein